MAYFTSPYNNNKQKVDRNTKRQKKLNFETFAIHDTAKQIYTINYREIENSLKGRQVCEYMNKPCFNINDIPFESNAPPHAHSPSFINIIYMP